jgi:hypothetical protein
MKRNYFFRLFPFLLFLLMTIRLAGQGAPNYDGGLMVKLNPDGSKYFRVLTWHQMWATFSNPGSEGLEADFMLRRSRVLMYAQLNSRFLILTHFGLNSLSAGTMGALSPSPDVAGESIPGRGYNGQLFIHDAWLEYTVVPEKLYFGGGLNYWNGVSRLSNASTLNMLTLDAPIFNWASIGTTGQFGRHIGFYAKGNLDKLDYRLAVNNALKRPTLAQNPLVTPLTSTYYNFDKPGGGLMVQGYVNYQFLDKESNKLPFMVGTYLGSKKLLNVGAGFSNHFKGVSTLESNGDTTVHNARTLAVDVMVESPLGFHNSAITFYGVWYRHDWGENLTGGVGGVGTGNILYGQLGILTPDFSGKVRVQPYFAYAWKPLQAYSEFMHPAATDLNAGANFFLEGHHAKITVEYRRQTPAGGTGSTPPPGSKGSIIFQAMVYL